MTPLSFALFLFAILIVPDLLWWWWADRRVRRVRWARIAVALFVVAMLVQPVALAFFREFALRSHEVLPVPYIAAAYLWQFLVLPATVALLLVGRAAPAPDESRRRFLVMSVAIGPPLLTAASVGIAVSRFGDVRLRELDVPVPGLPPALDGLVIAHVSDLHVGKFTVEESLARATELTNAIEADLVLGTGDLLDLSIRDLPQAVEFLRTLDPRKGHFWCEGNHDLIDDPQRFHAGMNAAGMHVLRYEHRARELRGERVNVVGAPWGDRFAMLPPEGFNILLAHHPHVFDEADGFPLVLAGHTHGGQLMLTETVGAGPVLFKYWSGLYRKANRTLVVNNGVGHWFPLRTAAPAEVMKLTLREGSIA